MAKTTKYGRVFEVRFAQGEIKLVRTKRPTCKANRYTAQEGYPIEGV